MESINENITIHKGDCMSILPNLPDNSISLLLTDIPYDAVNMGSNGLRVLDKGKADFITFELEPYITEINRIVSGSAYVFCGWEQISPLVNLFKRFGWSTRIIVWEKTNPSPMNGEHIWLSGVEFAVFAKKSGATFNAHCRNCVMRHPSGTSKEHPTEKPISLFADIINVSSNPNDCVLDTCMGGGTTGIACAKYNRRFIGVELDEHYYEIAKRRITEAQQQLTLF